MEIVCNFRLVLEGKTTKEISESSRLEFLEKLLANNFFALSDAEDNTSGPLNRGGIADLDIDIDLDIADLGIDIENNISNSPKVPRAKFLGSDGIFCFTSVCKFGSFKTLLQ